MFTVNCPKTRNEEFGQLLEALTEKYDSWGYCHYGCPEVDEGNY